MNIAQLWTILGVTLGTFVALGVMMLTLFLHMDNKIDALGNKLEAKIEAQGKELEAKIEAQGKELGTKIEAQGNKISKIEGQMDAVLELVPHPTPA